MMYDDRKNLAPRPEFGNYGQQAETCRMFHNCCSLAKKLQQFKQSFVKTYFKLDFLETWKLKKIWKLKKNKKKKVVPWTSFEVHLI